MAPSIKSNDRMPARSFVNIQQMVHEVANGPHSSRALDFMLRTSPRDLFEILHSIRRWYSGQTMARSLRAYRDVLRDVMRLDPCDVIGVYRGFKVSKDDPLAHSKPGDRKTLGVTRNHGFSSWSLTEAPTHRFSGASAGKVGLVVRLLASKGVEPVLAPPERTARWFNSLYEAAIGHSFRPTEQEYLIYAPRVTVEIVRVKR
jgi:hypothetical protein